MLVFFQARERNRGLFLADQNRGSSAIRTRQNNGNRYGFECPEESNYYPYWHPSPWKDIAVITSTPERCSYYREESENVKGRGECVWKNGPAIGTGPRAESWYNNERDCTNRDHARTDAEKEKVQEWVVRPAHGLPPPQCLSGEKFWTRSNHLGNTRGGYNPVFNWTIPEEAEGQKCVLRLRYNISTKDYQSQDGFRNTAPSKEAKPLQGYTEIVSMRRCLTANATGFTIVSDCSRNASQYWSLANGRLRNQAFPNQCLQAIPPLRTGSLLAMRPCNASEPLQGFAFNRTMILIFLF